MAAKRIPFSPEDRATIRSTSTWMLIAGTSMALAGGYVATRLIDPLMHHGLAALGVFMLPATIDVGLVGLGILLVVGSRRFAAVAASGDVEALGSGLTALMVVYVVQAVLMLLALGVVVLMFVVPMMT
jgi:hypothetical protein